MQARIVQAGTLPGHGWAQQQARTAPPGALAALRPWHYNAKPA